MDNKELAFNLFKIAEYNRTLEADKVIKSSAPNPKELCSGKLNFAELMSDLEKNSARRVGSKTKNIDSMLKDSTHNVKIDKTVRQYSVDLSQAQIMNTAMARLLNHSIKQERSVIDNFRVQ
ncbi:MAG: hypothetical protein SFT81_02280 [Candidatus Caenarcaniphilales bacterium]|nr:hypothetical protein [Candidatus Caenarcaniphilales bacterium]